MNKIIRFALACGALTMALAFTPQPAKAWCAMTEHIVNDEQECMSRCAGCAYYYDGVSCICY